MECKCSINVKSSPGCATDRNIKRYHLRAKWCVCVFKEHFSEQFFFNPPFPVLHKKHQIISDTPPTFSCATMPWCSSLRFLCFIPKIKI